MDTLRAKDSPRPGTASGLGTTSESKVSSWTFSHNPAVGIILPVAACLSLLAACILGSAAKQQLVDEIYTRTEASDPSLRHLFHALQHMGTGEMPLFYITVWPWAHLFGHSDLALRLYSSVFLCAAMLLMGRTLGRYWPRLPASLGLLAVWCGCSPILYQNVEARYYGLYLFVAVSAVAAMLRVVTQASLKPSTLMLLALSQAALVLTHALAPLYAVLLLAALILIDRAQRRFRPAVYLCFIAGWLSLLLWLPAIRATLEVGRPRGWILVPDLSSLFVTLNFGMFSTLLLPLIQHHALLLAFCIGVIFAGIAAAALSTLPLLTHHATPAGRRALLIIALALLTAPIFFFAVSRLLVPIAVARYMLPSVLGLAIIFTTLADRYLSPRTIFTACLVLLPLPLVLTRATIAAPLDVVHIESVAGPALPIVAGSQNDFAVLLRYSPTPQRYVYLLDWQTALRGSQSAVADFHLMQAYREQGYFAPNIQDQPTFICSHPDFLVLENTSFHWFDVAIAPSPSLTPGAPITIDAKRSLIPVHRSTPCAASASGTK